jgi:predicted GIY-YIG superfamily endonuclease
MKDTYVYELRHLWHTVYYGISNNIQRRVLEEHKNSGKDFDD